MSDQFQYLYLHEGKVDKDSYYAFLKKYYGENAEFRINKRYTWYKRYLGFRCLLALKDDTIVGQSCAFKVRIMTPEGEREWWWGCDSFVLQQYRGLGVGKGLQTRLYTDLPNFSSVGYSDANGYVKLKSGAHSICLTYPSLYPISRYLSVWSLLAKQIVFKQNNTNKYLFPAIPLYSLINKVNVSNYIIKEGNFNAKNLQYIDECLKVHYDFYVIRDEQYIKWKFDENPSVKYHLLEVYDGNGLKGLLVFSIAYNGFIFRCPLRMCKLYDMYFKDNGLTLKEVVQIINNYFIGRNEKIEAIYGLFKGNYRPTIRYPKTGRKLLSSYKGAFASPYFSLSDQDLDQITDT